MTTFILVLGDVTLASHVGVLREFVFCWWKKLAVVERLFRQLGTLFKVMLHRTIQNDDVSCNTALQCWINSVTIRNNVATFYRRKSSRVTLPLMAVAVVEKLQQESMYEMSAGTKKSSQCREVAVVERRSLVKVRLYAPSARENHFPRGWWLIPSHAKVGHRRRERRAIFTNSLAFRYLRSFKITMTVLKCAKFVIDSLVTIFRGMLWKGDNFFPYFVYSTHVACSIK